MPACLPSTPASNRLKGNNGSATAIAPEAPGEYWCTNITWLGTALLPSHSTL